MYEGQTYPLLRSFMTHLTVSADNISKIYDGQSANVSGVTYSTTPNANLLGTLGYGGVVDAGNYAMGGLYSNQQGYIINYVDGTLKIDPATLSLGVAANPQAKVYGSLDPVFTFNTSGLANGDTAASVLSGSLSRILGENVGKYAITQGSLSASSNYILNFTGADLTISPATLNVVANSLSKIYGSVDPTLGYSVSGLQFDDAATGVLSGGLSRALGKNVGSYAISQGALASNSNYSIQYTGANLDITPYAMTISALAQSRVYDGSTSANVALSNNGIVGDNLSVSFAAADFADKNVGIAKSVSVSGISLGGADAGNYTFNTSATALADITAKALTVSGITASNKVYDGTTNATVSTSGASLNGLIAGDVLSLSATGTFANKNVGVGKIVALSSTYSGADVGNYSITSQASSIADITAKALTYSGPQISDSELRW
jgi:hypothetical protein